MLFEALPIGLQRTLVKLSVYRLPIALEMAQAMEAETEFEDLELLVSRGLLLLQDDDLRSVVDHRFVASVGGVVGAIEVDRMR